MPELDFKGLRELLGDGGERLRGWVNLGGQIVPAFKVDGLREQIRVTEIKSWQEIHGVYETWRCEYPLDKTHHAWAVLALLRNRETQPALDAQALKLELEGALKTRQWISCQILETRAKDFHNPFRKATFRNQAEKDQVVGSEESGAFIKTAREEELSFAQVLERAAARL
jgi:hypothetical protein